jgi:hypothetical protein
LSAPLPLHWRTDDSHNLVERAVRQGAAPQFRRSGTISRKVAPGDHLIIARHLRPVRVPHGVGRGKANERLEKESHLRLLCWAPNLNCSGNAVRRRAFGDQPSRCDSED